MWRLICGRVTVAVCFVFGGDLLSKSNLGHWPLELCFFVWILGVILWCAFGALAEADHPAEMLGEP